MEDLKLKHLEKSITFKIQKDNMHPKKEMRMANNNRKDYPHLL